MSFTFSLNFEYKLNFPSLDLTTVLSSEFSGFGGGGVTPLLSSC